MPDLPRPDLDHVLEHGGDAWTALQGGHVLITGAAGFVGSWLLESLLHARRARGLDVGVTALVRDTAAFRVRHPALAAAPGVRALGADVRTAPLDDVPFTHVVHCASAASPRENADDPGAVVDLIERGTTHVLEAAESREGVRFLQMSSGSVYGPQPPALDRIPESWTGAADAREPGQRFGAAKLAAERRGNAAVARGVGFVAARAFAVVGPRLPMGGTFAVGNFLADTLAGRPVEVRGDGTPVRTWMHAADLAAWCWTILARGTPGRAYNVGSNEAMTVGDAAGRVAALADPPVSVTRRAQPDPSAAPDRFVPDVTRARTELGLEVRIGFDDALRRTWEWLRS
ncbi:MAG: NAD(P)-dependent oxidoreductase [Gemmatimonadota bacterium]|nr:NAD(P)-dependent oxidoreductase [Gemmatimonadota bacterium]